MSTLPVDAPPTPPAAPPAVGPLPEVDIDYDSLVTEDHKPVDRIFVEKLYRLLTSSLYASWPGPGSGRPFLALANVGWFYQHQTPAVVPDCLLSLDVTCPADLQVKEGHSYYQWQMGKPPDVVIEIVSDRSGGEDAYKKDLYARLGVPYYAIYDPKRLLAADALQTYAIADGEYRPVGPGPWARVGLGLRLWRGAFEGVEDVWLRWCDNNGEIIPTGEERAAIAEEQAMHSAEQARRAEEQAKRAEERLRQLEAELRLLKGEPPA